MIGEIAKYTQLERWGREWRGKCPACLGRLVVTPERWRCFSCGAHDHGDTLQDFLRIAQSAGLQPGEPRLIEQLKGQRWERIDPPQDQPQPELSNSWLGQPSRVEEQRTDGKLTGYRAWYEQGPMDWIYARLNPSSPGHWRPRRIPNSERSSQSPTKSDHPASRAIA